MSKIRVARGGKVDVIIKNPCGTLGSKTIYELLIYRLAKNLKLVAYICAINFFFFLFLGWIID